MVPMLFCINAIANGCPIPDSWQLVNKGKIVMTVNPTIPPQEYVDEAGNLHGLNIDLTEAIAQRLCLAPVFVRIDAQGMIPGLKDGRYDMVNNGFFWTPERAKMFYLVPYAQHGFTIMTAKGSTLNIHSFADLSGLRLGVESTSYPDVMARRDSAALVAKGMKPVTIMGFENGAAVLSALRAHQIDASVTVDETGASIAASGGADIRAVGLWSTQIALAFRNHDLAEASANALTQIRADGLYDQLFDKYKMHRLDTKIFAIRGPD
jgi:polar amino acid transport system substrate-binding protein